MKIMAYFRRIRHGSSSKSKPPFALAVRSSNVFTLGAVCMTIFTDTLLYGLIVPVIPYALTDELGIPEDEVQQWNAILLACYSLALFVGSPVVGIYADRLPSRRVPWLFGLVVLAGSTLLLCFGKTIALLILGRILQGFSSAIGWSVGLALLADTMGKRIGEAVGYVTIAMSVGLLVAPLMGGAIYQAVGYNAVYYVVFAFIFCDIVLRLLLVEQKTARQWSNDDKVESNARDSPDHPCVTQEKEDEAQKAETTITTEKSQAYGVDCPKYPQWTLIKSKRILAALFGFIIEAGLIFAFDTVVPILVRDTYNWPPTATGLIFLCIFLPTFISPWVGALTDRFGAKWFVFAGFAASIPLIICFRFVDNDDTIEYKILLGSLLAMSGVTLTFCNVPLMAEITFAIEAKESRNPGIWGENGAYGIGYGLYCTAFALGGTIGSLMAGYLKAKLGWDTMTWSLAIWCASGAIVTALWVGERPHLKRE